MNLVPINDLLMYCFLGLALFSLAVAVIILVGCFVAGRRKKGQLPHLEDVDSRLTMCAYCKKDYLRESPPGPQAPPPHTCSFECREKELQKPKWRQYA